MNYNKNARKLGATNIQLKVINFHLGSLENLEICINGTNYWNLSDEHSFSKQNIFRVFLVKLSGTVPKRRPEAHNLSTDDRRTSKERPTFGHYLNAQVSKACFNENKELNFNFNTHTMWV